MTPSFPYFALIVTHCFTCIAKNLLSVVVLRITVAYTIMKTMALRIFILLILCSAEKSFGITVITLNAVKLHKLYGLIYTEFLS